MSQGRNPGPIPPRWLHCPRKSMELVAGKFLAFKTPLDDRYDLQVPAECKFGPDMIFSTMKSYKVKIGLWIDLCNTNRFYDQRMVERLECRYVKLQCRGHGEAPSAQVVQEFVHMCRKFTQQHPLEVIGVHCTHGFNRTGFLIAAYLIEAEDWSPEAAVAAFAKVRPPGIYKEDYLQELFSRYGDVTDAPAAPELPDWCYMDDQEDSRGVDEDGNPAGATGSDSPPPSHRGGENGHRRRESNKKNPQFMEGVPGVSAVTTQPLLGQIQRKVSKMCNWSKSGFPGAQPVSMDRQNVHNLAQMPYKVSWKADGTRYMMLIDGMNRTFFVDRDNCVFQVENLTFYHRKMPNRHIVDTLLDGEMVIDEFQSKRYPRYLAYDIIRYEGEEVGKTNFSTRLLCIEKEIIQTRAKYMQEGKIDKSREPFSIRKKEFWPLSEAPTLLGPKFTKENLGHEPDGLVFQPSDEPYKPGRDDNILKWKPSSHNSVDFKLQIVKENRPGMLPQTLGMLYVGGLTTPFATMKVTRELKELHNRIVECTWDAKKNEWAFMRERTDKSYANAYSTAQGVIKSIQEPVTTEMLLDFIDRHQFRRPIVPMPPPPSSHFKNGQVPAKKARTH